VSLCDHGSCWFSGSLLFGEYAPRLLRLTSFRLEIVAHIPPPLGIPLSCVLGFAKDAAVLVFWLLYWPQIYKGCLASDVWVTRRVIHTERVRGLVVCKPLDPVYGAIHTLVVWMEGFSTVRRSQTTGIPIGYYYR